MSSNIYTNTTPTRTALDNMKYINTEIRIIDGISNKKKKTQPPVNFGGQECNNNAIYLDHIIYFSVYNNGRPHSVLARRWPLVFSSQVGQSVTAQRLQARINGPLIS